MESSSRLLTHTPEMCRINRMDPAKLYKEAAFVGIALIPMWFAVSKFTTAVKWFSADTQWKSATDVLISGALFHLVAEETGLNAYYLTNSFAAEKAFKSEFRNDVSVDGPVDLLRCSRAAFGL